ncbi:serine/arginine-rich splicing factor 4-like [Mercenaria mercenaria]|uniref:serine/arginine-rich splicing factor 4-like n=1 Tax=Mercenaria mercenaria TaxID=6596 RepID=UPI00234F4BBE|nr:serine/arginine-rich splicing factor 4-like [Mercenaria mercenaria]
MAIMFCFCLLVPVVLAIETSDVPQKLKPKGVTNVVETHLKDIPSAEIRKHFLRGDDKNKITLSEKRVNLPEIIEIKPLVNTVKAEPVNSKPDKNKSKIKKWRSKLARKQKKALRKKNKLRLKRLRKQQNDRKKQMQKRKKLIKKGKKQMRNIQSNKLSEVIDRILSYHRKVEGSKLSTKHIQQQIIDLINAHKEISKVIKPTKDCPKPKIGKRKDRTRLRSLNRNKTQRKQPRKVVALKGRQRVSVNRGRGQGKGVSRKRGKNVINKGGRSRTYATKGKKGEFKPKVTVRIGNKEKSRRNKKKAFKNTVSTDN